MDMTTYEQLNDTPWVSAPIIYDDTEDSCIPRTCVKKYRVNMFQNKGARFLIVDTIGYNNIQVRKMILHGKIETKTLYRRSVVITSTHYEKQTRHEFHFTDDRCAFDFQTEIELALAL